MAPALPHGDVTMTRLALVGDIGGTNARFALAELDTPSPRVGEVMGLKVAEFPRATDAIAAFLAARGMDSRPAVAVIAVAGPVQDGAIDFTNSDWLLSEGDLVALGCGRARLINDYAALALAAPRLAGADLRTIGPQVASQAGGTIAVLGPGTGFGVSALVRDSRGEAVLSTEGGHIGFAPTDEVEIELLRRLSARHGRVSIERILSGSGLDELHETLVAMDGRDPVPVAPARITAAALAGDPAALRSVERFCAILGSVAGDFALAYGASGGVLVAGGIAPRIIDILEASAFRTRFEAKGRFRDYLAAVPTQVIVRPHAALLGAARAAVDLAAG